VAGLVRTLAAAARTASRRLARSSATARNGALLRMAEAIGDRRGVLKTENARDMERAHADGLAGALVDRLTLTDARIDQMARGLREIAALPDPVGEVLRMWVRPNGLRVGRMRIPLGVVGVIYESRPNVTADAAGLCVKSGNAVVLRGGSEALCSNRAIAAVLAEGLAAADLPAECVTLVPVADRAAVLALIRLDDLVDVVIPRGGEGLIRFVVENATVPVIKHDKGVCHVYVDRDADLDMALRIVMNGKVQRPGVCNATEALLVHRDVAAAFLPRAAAALRAAGVVLRGCPRTRAICPDAEAATDADWGCEYLDLILAVRVVDDHAAAVEHILRYGSRHTDAIVTRSLDAADAFVAAVDSSAVMVNASTRFNDGYQLGLGAEMGISTSKLHCFGPMGVEDLTTTRYVIYGRGQTRDE
jgi:glutamate-5-semialdehyde dehydrogenase